MKLSILTMLVCLVPSLFGQTIAEKKDSFAQKECEMNGEMLEQLTQVNQLLKEKRLELQFLYDEALALYQNNAEPENYECLLSKIHFLKGELSEMQHMWREETASLTHSEEYALWHQPETTIGQIVIDYGSPDFIYLIPSDLGSLKLCISSNLPIPRECWGECLELVLSQQGVGIRQLTPYLRELFFLHDDPSGLIEIVDKPSTLQFFAPQSRICFLLTPHSADPRSELFFLQKFSNPIKTKIEILSGKIFITGTTETIQELLKLHAFVEVENGGQDFQLVSLSKMEASEMETILNAAFHGDQFSSDGSTLRVIPLNNLSQSLFLTGSQDDVTKAIKLIRDVELQIEDPQEKTVFWYTTKHSDAEELASVLAKVYDLLIGNRIAGEKNKGQTKNREPKKGDSFVVPATHVEPRKESRTSHKTADGQNNFIVDPKTGAIIMVVEQEALPKIKELLKKLDIPKKMVQLEVLLFEKRISNQSKFGLNLLRLGTDALQAASTGLSWVGNPGAGILEFLISRDKGSGIPAYDFAYQFLLGQEDVQINASPSVTTMNQTPAKIAIVEEISIDSGADKDHKKMFSRAQYGIAIEITPTINIDDSEENETGTRFITLDTDITFDTPQKNPNDRPDVIRRHIKNHVRIADGQTVILGGLRRKNTQDTKDSIPFLGEIPGIGKLFSHTEMSESSTEMFIFITPKIIADAVEDASKMRREECFKRPGDVPEYLNELLQAKDRQKRRLFERSLTSIFGRNETHSNSLQTPLGEYEGK